MSTTSTLQKIPRTENGNLMSFGYVICIIKSSTWTAKYITEAVAHVCTETCGRRYTVTSTTA
jgi:hypothetical protein